MNNATRSMKITVTIDAIYEDASGAPGVVRIDGHAFACDYLGEARMNLISGARPPGAKQVAIARRTYVAAVIARAGSAWLARNKALYAEAQS